MYRNLKVYNDCVDLFEKSDGKGIILDELVEVVKYIEKYVHINRYLTIDDSVYICNSPRTSMFNLYHKHDKGVILVISVEVEVYDNDDVVISIKAFDFDKWELVDVYNKTTTFREFERNGICPCLDMYLYDIGNKTPLSENEYVSCINGEYEDANREYINSLVNYDKDNEIFRELSTEAV